jgi:hypothetical protein
MKRTMMLALACLVAITGHAEMQSQASADKEAVKAAAMDYIEGLYQAQPERIARSVDQKLAKVGYFRRGGESAISIAPMSYQQLYDLAGTWNKDGKRQTATAPKDVVVYEVLSQTASAKITALWGIDYIHLARATPDGKWKIVNVLWQEHPK